MAGKIEVPISIKELQNGLDSVLKKAIKHEYCDAEIYFVTPNQLKSILMLKFTSEKLFLDDKPKDTFYQIGKLLNEKSVAIGYKFFERHKYVNISKRETVIKEIEKLYILEKNKVALKYKNILSQGDHTDFDLKNLKEREREELEQIEEGNNFLNDNIDVLDVRITTFKDKKIYPSIYFLDTKGQPKDDYLRKEVPNILCVHENIFLLETRKDANFIKFVLTATRAYGNIFYKYIDDNTKG
jgi:hypothetical protein